MIEGILRKLALNNILNIIPRRGCYVSSDVRAALVSAGYTSSVLPDIDAFLRPKTKPKTLVVYLTEAIDSNLQIWHEEFDILRDQLGLDEIRFLSCHNGHIQDIWNNTHIDVALIGSQVIDAIGPDSFVCSADLIQGGQERFLPVVRDWIGQTVQPMGAPFSLFMRHLFLNRRMMEQARITVDDLSTPTSLLTTMREVAPRMTTGAVSLQLTSNLSDLLIANGALYCEEGLLHLNDSAALEVLEVLSGSGLKVGSNEIETFTSGNAIAMLHCTYQCMDFAKRSAFHQMVQPMPRAKDAILPAELMVIAINVASPFIREGMEIARHFTSMETQTRFGRQGGNIPVLIDALNVETIGNHAAGRDNIIAQLRYSTLSWPKAAYWSFNRDLWLRETALLLDGVASPQDLAARIRLVTQLSNQRSRRKS